MPAPQVLINALSVSQGGGGRSYILNLLRELDRDGRGFEFTILALAGAFTEEERGRHRLREIRLPRRGRSFWRLLYEQVWLPLVARSYDLLYCPADLLPRWCPVPIVVALRNLNIYDRRFYDTPRTRLLARLVASGVARAAAVACPSRAAADAIADSVGFPRERFDVVPHGISQDSFAPDAQPPRDAPPYLFLAANLERHKNFELVFDALPLLRDRGLQFWIAGGEILDPEWASYLRARVDALGLQQRVRFLGNVPYAQVLSLYRGAQALVFPSRLETFGHPLLEAMLAKTPIIASDIPASREIAEGVALFVPPDDATALAQAIEATVSDRESTEARVRAGRERAARFTWKRSIDQLSDLFRRALEGR